MTVVTNQEEFNNEMLYRIQALAKKQEETDKDIADDSKEFYLRLEALESVIKTIAFDIGTNEGRIIELEKKLDFVMEKVAPTTKNGWTSLKELYDN